MAIHFEHRASDSPAIERVWRSHSDHEESMTSVASAHWTLVAWRVGREWRVAAQGPEARASTAPVPPETEFVGIRLALGMRLAQPATDRIVGDAAAFSASKHSVRIGDVTLPVPAYDDAEDLVRRLIKTERLLSDPLVINALRGEPPAASIRTVRRHFLATTGLTAATVRQIERARAAAVRIRAGQVIADVAYDLGYYDQPHLSRSLTRFLGHPAGALRDGTAGQLSLLYKT
ncbi:helix-turn-helix domain-containing protein [Microlunatus parietis]|nr:helix-turn-helix domain-containing protein [Microlunatus parietis]